MAGGVLFRVEGLLVSYRGQVALEVDELEVPAGKVLVVGPNGSGKTTLVRALLGLVRPRRGRVALLGLDPFRDARLLYRRVTFIRDVDELPGGLRLGTLVKVLSDSYGADEVRRAVRLLELDEHLGKRLRELSRGLRRRASILVAAASNRDLIIIDEPFSGVDSKSRRVISRILDGKDSNMIIISHVPPAMRFDYLVFLEGGSVAYSGPYRDPGSLGLSLC